MVARAQYTVTVNGTTKTLSEWAKCLGTRSDVIWQRIHTLGWDPILAVTTKVRPHGGTDCPVDLPILNVLRKRN